MKSINVFSAFFTFWVTLTSACLISNTEEASRENLRKLTLANNELTFNLHRKLVSGSSKNVFFSPLSISTVLGMLFYGAKGNTAQELRVALGYEKADLPNNLVHNTFHSYLSEELGRENSSDGYALSSANAILVDKELGLLDEYRRNVQELYRAAVQDVDFLEESDLIVKKINDYVRENTNGKINKVLNQLEPTAVMILLNAVYFKGTWEKKFDPKGTKEGIFFNNGRETEERRVPFMHLRTQIRYATVDNVQAIELPYRGGNVSMLILLPTQRDGLQDLEETLTPELLDDIKLLMYTTTVDVKLPKFKLEYQKELSPEVHALGAKQIFGGGADFSGLISGNNLQVSQVFHKAVIEVNELGSEAAAVTRGSARSKSGTYYYCGPPEFKADHPFLFTILEKGSNSSMILFLGSVNNL